VYEKKIKLTSDVKRNIKENGGAYILIYAWSHATVEDMVGVEIYQVYLTK